MNPRTEETKMIDEKIERLTNLLMGYTPIDISGKTARKYCRMVAGMAVRQVKQHYGLEKPVSLKQEAR